MLFNPLGLVVFQPVLNFGLLYTKGERFSVYFRKKKKNISAHFVAKQGKGRTPSKGLKVFKWSLPEKLFGVKEVFFFFLLWFV